MLPIQRKFGGVWEYCWFAGAQMEVSLRGGLIGGRNIFIRKKLRRDKWIQGRPERQRQERPPFYPMFFGIAGRHDRRDGNWVINRLSTIQNCLNVQS